MHDYCQVRSQSLLGLGNQRGKEKVQGLHPGGWRGSSVSPRLLPPKDTFVLSVGARLGRILVFPDLSG